MTIKYLALGRAAGDGARRRRRARSRRAVIGALIVRLRGVYFAMVTIAFGQVFYFIAFRWNARDRRRRRPERLAAAAARLRLRAKLDIVNNDKAFYYFALVVFAGLARRRWRC